MLILFVDIARRWRNVLKRALGGEKSFFFVFEVNGRRLVSVVSAVSSETETFRLVTRKASST